MHLCVLLLESTLKANKHHRKRKFHMNKKNTTALYKSVLCMKTHVLVKRADIVPGYDSTTVVEFVAVISESHAVISRPI